MRVGEGERGGKRGRAGRIELKRDMQTGDREKKKKKSL